MMIDNEIAKRTRNEAGGPKGTGGRRRRWNAATEVRVTNLFTSLAFLSGIALFSSAAAQNVWQVTVSDATGDTVYTPNNIVSQVQAAQPKDAEAALRLSKKRMQTDIEQRCQPYKFNVGDRVWLQAKQINIHQQSSKLGPKQLGPFEVIEVRSDVDYKLALPPALKVHDVFHVDCLSPYKGNKVNGLTPRRASRWGLNVGVTQVSQLFGR
jgi:hypothetical protein